MFVTIALIAIMSTVKTENLREAAEAAARWIDRGTIEAEPGLSWPAAPGVEGPRGSAPALSLYSGSPGVVLFFLALHEAYGETRPLELAKGGADRLIAELDSNPKTGAGLYTGVAGWGFTLAETYRITGEAKYREAVDRCVAHLERTAVKVGDGVEWGAVTDIISGTAGTGLFLLDYAERFDRDSAKALAARAGHRLLAQAVKTDDGGAKWRMSATYERWMPNFSHGTAGVAYFLATLFTATGEKKFLDGARAGMRYLNTITNEEGLIFHHEPGGESLYYLGWCHGPVGTARLSYRLWEITAEKAYRDQFDRSIAALRTRGLPSQEPGFWNNVGQCCGSAGVAEFALMAHRQRGNEGDLELAELLTKDLLSRGTTEDGSLSWVQSEHRVRPDLLEAQTGYMQGASGIGLWLLRLDAHREGREFGLRFPDSPY